MAKAVIANVGASRIQSLINGSFQYRVSRAKFFNLDGIPDADNVANAIYDPQASQTSPRGTEVFELNHVTAVKDPNSATVSFEVALNLEDNPTEVLVSPGTPLVQGKRYVIRNAGSGSLAQWQTLGLPNSESSADVGDVFTASSQGATFTTANFGSALVAEAFVFGAIGFYIVDGEDETLLLHLVLDSQVTKQNNRNNLAVSTYAIKVPFNMASTGDASIRVTEFATLRAHSQAELSDVPNASAANTSHSNLYVTNGGGANRNEKDQNQVLAYKEHGTSPDVSNLWGLSNFQLAEVLTVTVLPNSRFSVPIPSDNPGLRSFFESMPAGGAGHLNNFVMQNAAGRLFSAESISYSNHVLTVTYSNTLSNLVADGQSLYVFVRTLALSEVERFALAGNVLVPISKGGTYTDTLEKMRRQVGFVGNGLDGVISNLDEDPAQPPITTDNLTEGSSNIYHTDARARYANRWQPVTWTTSSFTVEGNGYINFSVPGFAFNMSGGTVFHIYVKTSDNKWLSVSAPKRILEDGEVNFNSHGGFQPRATMVDGTVRFLGGSSQRTLWNASWTFFEIDRNP